MKCNGQALGKANFGRFIVCLFPLLLLTTSALALQNPFGVTASLQDSDNGRLLFVYFKVPQKHYLYADSITVESPGIQLAPFRLATPESKKDPLTQETKQVFAHDFDQVYQVRTPLSKPLKVMVNYQGCKTQLCYAPETKEFTLQLDKSGATLPTTPILKAAQTPAIVGDFKILAQGEGYMDKALFMAFLDGAEKQKKETDQSLLGRLRRSGHIWAILLILLGGIGLNFTPCVLPLIPVNIAIIGAGARAGSKRRGFFLGSAYGLGIALTYGLLGLTAVLTGAVFGTINSSAWFNLSIAVLFLLLALAMFDVFPIDLSRFRHPHPKRASAHHLLSAFGLGSVSALLAGACVAPVLIAVLVLSTEMRSEGRNIGLALPFILGMGMALPWPFAGAGLSFLPKPGRWMRRVDYLFGAFLIALAIYYGNEAFAQRKTVTGGDWMTSLPLAIQRAGDENKVLFIDFDASWCKSCLAMDETTFANAEVQRKMRDIIKVKFHAEDPLAPGTREILQQFNVLGFPTYVIMKAEKHVDLPALGK